MIDDRPKRPPAGRLPVGAGTDEADGEGIQVYATTTGGTVTGEWVAADELSLAREQLRREAVARWLDRGIGAAVGAMTVVALAGAFLAGAGVRVYAGG